MKFKTYTGKKPGDGWETVDITVEDDKWVLRVKISTYLTSHPQDKRFGTNEEGLPDARMRPHTQVVAQFICVLGASQDEITVHQISDLRKRESHDWSNTLDLLLTCDHPFAVLYIADDQEYPSQSGYRRDCVRVARQVHKGELSRTFNPVELESVDSAHKINDTFVRYVRLMDVAQAIGMDPIQCLRTFAVVSPSSYYDPNAAIWSNPPQDRRLTMNARLRIYQQVPTDGDCWGASQWGASAITWSVLQANLASSYFRVEELLIPMAWARDILVLSHFGFVPGVNEEPERSFGIEADQPEPYTWHGLLPPFEPATPEPV
ncbi:MAG: hypothetical protein AAB413_03550 [Patescibacteria group bacterium]